MKLHHLILAAGILTAAGCESTSTMSGDTSTAQASTAIVVSPVAQSEFTLRYPSATSIEWARYNDVAVPIDWELTGWPVMDADDYVVTYELNGNKYYSWYDSNGVWVGTSYTVFDHESLPDAVDKMLSEKYSGQTIQKIDLETWGNQSAYEIKLKSPTHVTKLLVDMNGNVLREKVKED